MRIAWFTPFHIKSAIGQVSNVICRELSKTNDIDIWTDCSSDRIQTTVNVIHYRPVDIDIGELARYDHVVYNMGNYAGYHQSIWEVMQRHKGIVIMHDQTMQGLFRQIMTNHEYGGDMVSGYEKFLKLIYRYYGEQGVYAFKSVSNSDIVKFSEDDLISCFPLIQPIFEHATGIFTHSSYFANKTKDYFLGLVGYSYLPYIKKYIQLDQQRYSRKDDSKLLIVSTGIVHPIKRVDKVFRVLLNNPDLAQKVHYVLIGEYGGPFGEQLKKMADGPLKGCVELLGYQPDSSMFEYLNNADICINLRYPNHEACSYSLIEQMAHELPVIVINSGFYTEIPNNAVVKINIDNEEKELEEALIRLVEDSDARREISKNAKEFVEQQCTVESYTKSFISLLNGIQNSIKYTRITKNTLERTNQILSYLGFSTDNLSWIIQSVTKQMEEVLLANDNRLKHNYQKTLGIWIGFTYAIPNLNREGILRFLQYMSNSLLRNFNIVIEIWTYSINEKCVELAFSDSLNDSNLKARIKIVTEKNWPVTLDVPNSVACRQWDANENKDNLCEIARLFSKAECFVPAIIYLDNVVETDKPLFVPVHDMSLHYHYESFVQSDPLYKARLMDIAARSEHLARSGAFMFCNCETVRRENLLKYVKNIRKESTAVVYLPVNIPKDIDKMLLSEDLLRRKFKLQDEYLFYASQIRPYKNVQVIIKALNLLIKNRKNIKLVLTGNPIDVLEVSQLVRQCHLESSIIHLQNVTEDELYSLYRYAAAVPVSTLFEGGFPWQACEALFMNTPLVLSRIPIVEERIESLGMTSDNCGLALFDPYDPEELANHIDEALRDKQGFVEKQNDFRERLLTYSWDDAARYYFSIFFGSE